MTPARRRALPVTLTAFCSALLWGLVEFVALARSRWTHARHR